MTSTPRRSALLGLLALGAAALLSGCGLLNPEAFPADGPTRTAADSPGNATRAEFGSAWPLEVDSGDVTCEPTDDGDPALIFTTPDGTSYALNQIAERDLPPLQDIATGSIGPLRTFAFTACDPEEGP